jgi:hypothetical protein
MLHFSRYIVVQNSEPMWNFTVMLDGTKQHVGVVGSSNQALLGCHACGKECL